MKTFEDIFAIAAERHGGPEALEAKLEPPPPASEVAVIPDDRWLSMMTRSVFQAGFSWKVIEAKWPGFEEAFDGFDVGRCAMMDDDWFDSLEQSGIAWHDVCAQTIAARQRAQDHAGHYPHSCPASGTGANHTPIDRQEPFLSAPETEHRRAAGAPTGSNGKSLHPDYAPITETRR